MGAQPSQHQPSYRLRPGAFQRMMLGVTERLLEVALLGAEWVMYVLAGLSMWSVAVMIERWLFFRRHRVDFEKLARTIREESIDRLHKVMEEDRSLEAAMLRPAIAVLKQGAEAVAETFTAAQLRERARAEHGLTMLGTLGNNAPFIGLFGTVLGIIQAFHDLSHNPQGGAPTVMAGISEALVATAVGLLVALPAVVAYNYFGKKAARAGQNAEALGHLLLARVKGEARN